jgi:hypothetical protein
MRTIVPAAAFGLALALAGCGREEAPPANEAASNTGVDVAEQLAALPDGQRNAVFIRAIRDAGEDCQHVIASSRAGEYQGRPVWSAQCDGGSSWTIVVTRDGTAQMINDAEARLVGVNQVAPGNAAADQNRTGR